MFNVGYLIVYEGSGICRISEIKTLELPDIDHAF